MLPATAQLRRCLRPEMDSEWTPITLSHGSTRQHTIPLAWRKGQQKRRKVSRGSTGQWWATLELNQRLQRIRENISCVCCGDAQAVSLMQRLACIRKCRRTLSVVRADWRGSRLLSKTARAPCRNCQNRRFDRGNRQLSVLSIVSLPRQRHIAAGVLPGTREARPGLWRWLGGLGVT